MATVFNPDEKDETGQESLGGPSSLKASSAPINNNTSAPMANRQGSGRATNIQNYINANTGGGERLAQGIQQNVQQEASKVQSDVDNARQQFESNINPLSKKLGEEGEQLIQTAFKNPQELLQQQSQLDQFKALRDRGAQQDIQQLGQQVQQTLFQQGAQAGNIQELADLGKTQAGRFQLLQQAFGNPSYSRGQQKLDQLLLQTQPEAGNQLQSGLQNISQQTNQAVSQLGQDTQAKLAALQSLADQRATDIQNLFQYGLNPEDHDEEFSGLGIQDLAKIAEDRLAEAQRDYQEKYRGLDKKLTDPKSLTTEDILSLGLKGFNPGQSIYDVNLYEFYSGMGGDPTKAGVADPQQFARYQALRELAGDTGVDVFGGVGADQIGQWNPINFDSDAAAQAIAQARQKYEVDEFNKTRNQAITDFQNLLSSAQNELNRVRALNARRAHSADLDERMQYRRDIDRLNTQIAQLSNDINQLQNVQDVDQLLQIAGSRQHQAWGGIQDYLNRVLNLRGNTLGQVDPNVSKTVPDGWSVPDKYGDFSNEPTGLFGKK